MFLSRGDRDLGVAISDAPWETGIHLEPMPITGVKFLKNTPWRVPHTPYIIPFATYVKLINYFNFVLTNLVVKYSLCRMKILQ